MGYLLKAGVGLALFFGAIVLFNVKLIELMETGTCASGNTPYEISRPCPPGTGTDIMLVTVSIFAGMIGAGLFAFRGEAPWSKGRRRPAGLFGWGALAWGFFFTSTGAAMLYTGFANDTVGPDGELAGKIVGFTFLAMGLPALLPAIWISTKNFLGGLGGGRDERPQMSGDAPTATSPAPGFVPAAPLGGTGTGRTGGDTVGRLERLQKLRESGAINDAEFEREKSKILAE